MSEQTNGDKVRTLLGAHASACLLDLQQLGQAPRAEAALQAGSGWAAAVSPCQRDRAWDPDRGRARRQPPPAYRDNEPTRLHGWRIAPHWAGQSG